ncbi:MAG: DNA translocase FtsK [Deltaproteobacteria bacterium]|nr:DNA translocase FtsK [Deltaproteobacteria bacterium]
MSTVKRRSTERKRSSRKSVPQVASLGPQGWGDEFLSLVSFAAAFFLLASLASQISASATLPLFDGSLDSSLHQQNVMGPVGRFISTLLLGSLGWCAFVPVLWLLWLGSYFWTFDRREDTLEVRSRFFWTLGLGASLVFSAGIAAIFWGRAGGGSLGELLASPLLRLFNVWGAGLFLMVGLLLSLAVVTRQKAASILAGLMYLLRDLAAFFLLSLPAFIVRIVEIALVALWNLARIALRAASSLLGRLRGAGSQVDERPLPSPRVRKNSFQVFAEERDKGQKEQSNDASDSDKPPAETNTHIVVSRRKSDFQLTGKGTVRRSKRDEVKEDDIPSQPSFADYAPPSVKLLKKGDVNVLSENDEELIQTSRQIEAKLRDFSIQGRVTQVHPGPVITLYEFEPAAGVKVGRISALQDDLAMSLRALSIRIIAPIPKRGTVGIEVPNKHREIVRLRDVLESESFVNADSILSVPIGKDTYGESVVVDIAQMPHLLMAGATGTGKSVCINTILLSLLYRATPAELGLILIDPKILELSVYEGIPHLRVPVVTNARQAKAVLDWAVKEMERRYRLMQKYGVRNIDGYNRVVRGDKDPEHSEAAAPESAEPAALSIENQEEEVLLGAEQDTGRDQPEDQAVQSTLQFAQKLEPLPKIVIVIDELADLMLTVGREIEELITRLAQKARAAGIHLIVATQRPSVDVITGLIKANFPARLSFRVTSRIDSRTILDAMGADKLLGRGDMLFMSPGSVHLKRIHGAYVADDEVKRVVESLKASSAPEYDQRIMDLCEQALNEERAASSENGEGEDHYDSMYDKAVELVIQKGQASTSMLQRAFRIGYNRAARIIDMMEREGIIGPMDGVKPRDVLVQNPEADQG